MSILNEIYKENDKWLRMAKRFDSENADDIVQDMYLKINALNPTEVNDYYIYRTIKSIFIDEYKKKKILTVPLNGKEADNMSDDYNEDADFQLSEIPLTCTELLVVQKLYGYTTENADTLQITIHKGKSLLSISKEVNLPYKRPYTALLAAKKKIYEYRIRRYSESNNGVL